MSIDPELVAERIGAINDLIARFATRPVGIVAVTKRFGLDAIHSAMAAGVADIGENYAQELVDKASAMAESGDVAPRWHFVGHVQRNKVRKLAGLVTLWHSVDTVALGAEIAKRAPGARVLVQVNASGSPSQSGVTPAAVPALVGELREKSLDVQGLMTIGAVGDGQTTSALFDEVRSLADDLELAECSMGMSGDMEEALRAGTTMVRVGTAIFGPRGE